LPHLSPHLRTEPAGIGGFAPAPEHGALLTGLLEFVASDSVPAASLGALAASKVAELIGDACLVCLLQTGEDALQPVAVADPDDTGAVLLRALMTTRVTAGRRPDLEAYIARLGLADELIAPIRSRGQALGELIALRRGASRPYTVAEKHTLQAVADVVGLGLGERRPPPPPTDVPAPDTLSRREREVLALLALGHTNREIAERVHLSVRTVEWHRARIQAKLHVTGRAALAQVARTHGLLGATEDEHDR
jgi:DNA-binding NarL/FixJ family response regulator